MFWLFLIACVGMIVLAIDNRRLYDKLDVMDEEHDLECDGLLMAMNQIEREWVAKYNEDIVALSDAHEAGRTEQEENYEMQFLSKDEQISRLLATIADLMDKNELLAGVVDYHEANCLPDLGTMYFITQLKLMQSS